MNQGTITADAAGGTITIGNSNGTFANQGTVSAANGGTLTINGNWSNAGAMNVNAGTLNLGGTFTTAGLGLDGFTRTGGTVNINGVLTGDLPSTAATGTWNLNGGQIRNGTVSATGGSSLVVTTTGNPVLDGVTVASGTLIDMTSGNNVTMIVRNSLVLNGSVAIGKPDASTYGQLYMATRRAGLVDGQRHDHLRRVDEQQRVERLERDR